MEKEKPINQTINILEKEIKENNSQLEKVEGMTNEAQKYYNELISLADRIQENLKASHVGKEKLEEIQREVSNIDPSLSKLEEKVNEVEKAISELEGRVNNSKTKFDSKLKKFI